MKNISISPASRFEFISQTGLSPETADRAARLYRDQRRVIADLMQQSSGHSPASGALAYEDHAAGRGHER